MTDNQSDFTNYQRLTDTTAIYPREFALEYLTLGLVGEAGEVANKVKKVFRDYDGQLTVDIRAQILDELGDVMWYVAQLCAELRTDMGAVAEANIEKLTKRKKNNTLKGSGDIR